MNPTKRLTGVCSECGGSIEFPAELVGTMTRCRRCGKQTELALAVPPEEPAVPHKVIIWTAITVVILVLGLIVTVVGLKHFERLAARQKDRAAISAEATDSAAAAGFKVSAFSLEKGKDGNGVYAVGTVVNSSNHRRSQVNVELDLLDAGGRIVEIARSFRPALEAGAKWEIKLSVAGDSNVHSVRVASIKADE
ncbi:MAG: FxLYD domain-containing protein [Limisphaerales bacterium]